MRSLVELALLGNTSHDIESLVEKYVDHIIYKPRRTSLSKYAWSGTNRGPASSRLLLFPADNGGCLPLAEHGLVSGDMLYIEG